MEFSNYPITYSREVELATMLNVARAHQKLVESSPFANSLVMAAAAAAVAATEQAHREYSVVAATHFAATAETVVADALREATLAGIEINY